MKVIKREGQVPIKAWVATKGVYVPNEAINNPTDHRLEPWLDIEETAMEQLHAMAKLPFIHSNGIAVMPDVHWGNGTSVGSVIPTYKAIVPASVGVDIGCGMNAVRTSLKATDLPDSLLAIRHSIERGVPVGFNEHKGTAKIEAGMIAMPMLPKWMARNQDQWDAITGGSKGIEKAAAQIGTLGGGNHFIELCLDEDQAVWIMLHSGSRGIGNKIGRFFIEKAKRNIEKNFITLPHKDLAYLPEDSDEFRDYIEAVGWAQEYALINRSAMMDEVLRCLRHSFAYMDKSFTITQEAINCHHNYISIESHFGKNVYLTRKGAIRAREGELGIIPGSMGTRSYIVRGKGNADSYHSCSHGAGRAMSRTAAGKAFTLADLKEQTHGVECKKDDSVLDEIPGAYKNIEAVMALQADLVDVVHTLKQVLCVKG
jgi:tRNA-splicing ligase RtcB